MKKLNLFSLLLLLLGGCATTTLSQKNAYYKNMENNLATIMGFQTMISRRIAIRKYNAHAQCNKNRDNTCVTALAYQNQENTFIERMHGVVISVLEASVLFIVKDLTASKAKLKHATTLLNHVYTWCLQNDYFNTTFDHEMRKIHHELPNPRRQAQTY